MTVGTVRKLDPNQPGQLTKLLMQQFSRKVVGQKKATHTLVEILENHYAGFLDKKNPIGNALFLGPTGTGKTHVVETFAESLFGTRKACIRIDCAEFQHSHEIAKLIGSPPGYLGHRETSPALTQEALNKYHTATLQVSILLFDEIEKASDALWSLLLGILDNATLTLGDNKKVDFANTIIIMTSNLGAREMANRGIGFASVDEEKDQVRLEKVALSAAKAKFSPEFMNRLQHIVMFQTLTKEQIEQVLDIELEELTMRLSVANMNRVVGTDPRMFDVAVAPRAKKRLVTEGWNPEYGARELKRVIDKMIQRPLSRMFNSGQINNGDVVVVDDSGEESFSFYTHNRTIRIPDPMRGHPSA
jgi:ATP-dependent Clp protease ATP-binding subunit ClpA